MQRIEGVVHALLLMDSPAMGDGAGEVAILVKSAKSRRPDGATGLRPDYARRSDDEEVNEFVHRRGFELGLVLA